jgi:hypothetical protein
MDKSIYGTNNSYCPEIKNTEFVNIINITLDILKQLNEKKGRKTALERIKGLQELIKVTNEKS